MFRLWIVGTVALVGLAVAPSVTAQTFIDPGNDVSVDQGRGADPTLDYATLVFFGPWDDRNCALTSVDLSLLATDEAEIREPL